MFSFLLPRQQDKASVLSILNNLKYKTSHKMKISITALPIAIYNQSRLYVNGITSKRSNIKIGRRETADFNLDKESFITYTVLNFKIFLSITIQYFYTSEIVEFSESFNNIFEVCNTSCLAY